MSTATAAIAHTPSSMPTSTLLLENVEELLLPSGRKFEASLEALLQEAQNHQRNCLIARTIATTIGAVGSIVTCVGISLSSATMGLSVTFTTPLAFSFTGLAAMTSIGTVLFDECILRRRIKEKLVKIAADYKVERRTWMDRLSLESVNDGEIATLYRSPEFQSSILETMKFSLRLKATDASSSMREIREGDHIVTNCRNHPNIRSHGIYIGKNADGVKLVADFGSHLPVLTPMHMFFSKTVFNVSKQKIIMDDNSERSPIMLLNPVWNHINSLTTKIAELSKPIQTTFDAIVATIHGGNLLFKVKFDNLFKEVLKIVRAKDTAGKIKWRTLEQLAPKKVKQIGGLSKTLVLLTPIMTAIDVYQLCKECQELDIQPHVTDILAQLNLVVNDVNTFENILQLMERKT